MLKRTITALALSALLAPAAMAQPVNTITETSAPPAPTSTSTSKDGKICKILVVTGSRVPQQKICLTKEQWAAKSDGAREGIEAMQRNGLSRNCIGQPGGGCGQ